MILGIGNDIIDIRRIEATIARYGDRFLKRVFTEGEIAYCQRKRDSVSSFAARFAAKEAFSKAMGTGFRFPVTLGQIIVVPDRRGKPCLAFRPELQKLVDEEGIRGHHLTISDEKSLACAVVVLEK